MRRDPIEVCILILGASGVALLWVVAIGVLGTQKPDPSWIALKVVTPIIALAITGGFAYLVKS